MPRARVGLRGILYPMPGRNKYEAGAARDFWYGGAEWAALGARVEMSQRHSLNSTTDLIQSAPSTSAFQIQASTLLKLQERRFAQNGAGDAHLLSF